MRNFSNKIEGDFFKILLGFTRIANPLKSPLGFSPQVVHVYIVGSCRSNRTETLGINVSLRAVDACCACVVVAPNLGNYVSRLVFAGGESLVLDKLYAVNNTIVAEVPARRVLEVVGGDVATWRYLVAVSAYDPASPDELIRIGVEKSDTPVVHAGANEESVRFLPRVLDILAKTTEDQYRMLSTFSPRHGDIATVGAYPYAENILLPAEPLVETLTVVTTSIATETYVRAYYLPGVTTTVTDYVQVPKYGLEPYLLAAISVTLLVILAFVLRKKEFSGK
ncbi:MAG: hypothetical protein NZ925_00980 [Sulfolobales archaeon]|nr:hypothetical protein [Sulfolobales archaeon]